MVQLFNLQVYRWLRTALPRDKPKRFRAKSDEARRNVATLHRCVRRTALRMRRCIGALPTLNCTPPIAGSISWLIMPPIGEFKPPMVEFRETIAFPPAKEKAAAGSGCGCGGCCCCCSCCCCCFKIKKQLKTQFHTLLYY